MKRLVVLPWESFGRIKAFRVFQTRVCINPANMHYARAGVLRTIGWKNKVVYVVEIKRFRKKKLLVAGVVYSLRKAKQIVDRILRDNNVSIKTRKQMLNLQVMR